MDLLTHALTAALLAYALSITQVLPFAVLGTVIIDVDIPFAWISARQPSLYLFTHGGFTHSIAGSFILSAIAWTVAVLLLTAGLVHTGLALPSAPVAFGAVLAGALLHISLDTLAVPGIPLLLPLSDRKYTAGLLPGPSVLLMASSLFFVILIGLRVIDLPGIIFPYTAVITAFLAVRVLAFIIARRALHGKGRFVPTINPLRWIVIGGNSEVWTVGEYRIGKGMGEMEHITKFRSTSAGEIAPFLVMPEVRRLWFHSYIVSAEKAGDEIVFSDPLRESGRIFYPPHHTRVRVHLPDPSGAEGQSSSSLTSSSV